MRTARGFGEVRFWIKARFGAGKGIGRMRVGLGGLPAPAGGGSPDFAGGLPFGGVGDLLTGDLCGLRDLSRESRLRQ